MPTLTDSADPNIELSSLGESHTVPQSSFSPFSTTGDSYGAYNTATMPMPTSYTHPDSEPSSLEGTHTVPVNLMPAATEAIPGEKAIMARLNEIALDVQRIETALGSRLDQIASDVDKARREMNNYQSEIHRHISEFWKDTGRASRHLHNCVRSEVQRAIEIHSLEYECADIRNDIRSQNMVLHEDLHRLHSITDEQQAKALQDTITAAAHKVEGLVHDVRHSELRLRNTRGFLFVRGEPPTFPCLDNQMKLRRSDGHSGA